MLIATKLPFDIELHICDLYMNMGGQTYHLRTLLGQLLFLSWTSWDSVITNLEMKVSVMATAMSFGFLGFPFSHHQQQQNK